MYNRISRRQEIKPFRRNLFDKIKAILGLDPGKRKEYVESMVGKGTLRKRPKVASFRRERLRPLGSLMPESGRILSRKNKN